MGQETKVYPEPPPKHAAILGLIRALREESEAIAGEAALGLATLIHAFGLDAPGRRWGNAYFRCPECGAARDVDAIPERDLPHVVAVCPNWECNADLGLGCLRLSEGWVDRVAMAGEFPEVAA